MTESVAFLLLDECSYEALDLAALTGVLVPSKRYSAVRDEMCQLVRDIQPNETNIIPAIIELHGRELLSGLKGLEPADLNTARFRVLETIVRIVNDYRLDIYRIAYLNRKEIAALMTQDPRLYGLTFSGVLSGLQETMKNSLVIPVMDGIPGVAPDAKRAPKIDPMLIRSFAQTVRHVHHTRQYAPGLLSIENAHNLGEPVFADSTHSALLQLVDLVSHLLLQLERDELELTCSPESGS